jgi:diguanylate cyclase (GGDEF)-like protein
MLSLVFFDIDHFKAINDDFGHLAGDYILQTLVSIIAVRFREADVLARYGGDEFALILPETDAEGAGRIAEKLRRLVEQHPFAFANNPIRVTISLGIRTTTRGVDKPDHMQLIADADANLYKAKRGGRNRVCG